jgi:hypothetical protein
MVPRAVEPLPVPYDGYNHGPVKILALFHWHLEMVLKGGKDVSALKA